MTAPIYSSGKQSRSDVGHSTNIRTAFYICQTLLKNKISEQHLRSNEGGFPTATKRMHRLHESSHGQKYRCLSQGALARDPSDDWDPRGLGDSRLQRFTESCLKRTSAFVEFPKTPHPPDGGDFAATKRLHVVFAPVHAELLIEGSWWSGRIFSQLGEDLTLLGDQTSRGDVDLVTPDGRLP